ncbi:MAG: sodium:solute symporter family protein [Cyclobacteriaceae bacterium]|nr:sodium:solute symporter family protein [Cyclobacteriaceae bacterium]
MHAIDFFVFAIYFFGILSVGFYFYKKNSNKEDFYVGGRKIGPWHVGLSIAATDVGGGFSIGLGGLGFTMGLAGSWLLFTGLVGAWMSAVLVVPRHKRLDMQHGLLTFPDFLKLKYNGQVATWAAVISGIGYLGFTAGQILAGGKLAAGSVFAQVSWTDPLLFSLVVMALVVVVYTVLGGIKAVIYTDTVQWIVLLSGLLFLGFPFAYVQLGGWQAIADALPASHFSLGNVAPITIVNWSFSIVPIWFIAMTLYQRVYASPDVERAKRAFFIAGFFEYPMMAFVGVGLGMLARVAFPESDPEIALPRLLTEVLPAGVAGFVLAAYFSAVMSTADSCLIASSGNFLHDLLAKYIRHLDDKQWMLFSQVITLILGSVAFLLASYFTSVLSLVLHSYSFMVSGLLVPTLIAYFSRFTSSRAAMVSMLGGDTTTSVLIFYAVELPLGLEATIFGIASSLFLYVSTYLIEKRYV